MADEDLTAEGLAAANPDAAAVAGAAVQAAATEPDPSKRKAAASNAAKKAAEERGITLSEQERNALADAIVDRIGERGGFDAPPEPVSAPAAPTAGEAPGSEPAAGQQPPEPPRKKTFAERFRGR